MGAVERYKFPHVWSPAGGWWCEPKHWKKNLRMAGLAIVPITFAIFAVGVGKEVMIPHIPTPEYTRYRGPHEQQGSVREAFASDPAFGEGALVSKKISLSVTLCSHVKTA